ncbi:hypothetical protein SKAU_G00299640 [Synaphobranchus kaupii]|uniref:Uncharacterized protein n=1 Tax=Synaphobranchus kaupii TaxID=118154 RepID=A0A9Q1EVA8_SYNKA|nr:hypothetical protein SKAU_G00299640 [Synaphobranchus kaupii]
MDIFPTREELDQLAASYISDTLSCIHTMQEFCDSHSKWLLQRKTELDMMRDISKRVEKINLTSAHIKKSKNRLKAVGEFLWSKLTQVTAESRAQELEKELESVLQDTLEGLEKLTLFLEAVEKLAVTSLSVFGEENPLCRLPKETSAAAVCSVIAAARGACPLLINFQRDAGEFFQPILVIVDVLAFQLDKYMRVSQELCEKLQKRLDQHFKMTFLFRGDTLRFIGLFSQRSSRMRQFLEALEEGAVQLDRMKMGSSISSVAGSTVGFAGGIISIVGLALAPVTAGASLTLTLVGVGLGVTSGVNSLATGIAEMSVNSHHGKKVNEVFQSYMEDVETILECLEQAASSDMPNSVPDLLDVAVGVGVASLAKTTATVGKGIDALVDCTSAVKVLKAEEVVSSAAKVVAQEVKAARNVPNVAADLTDLGQLAKGTPLALSKSARAGFIALNSIFMGLDVFFICKDSISLAKGSKSDVSKLIRGWASLWKTELDAWERIHHSLFIGIWRFRKSMEVLERPFYS